MASPLALATLVTVSVELAAGVDLSPQLMTAVRSDRGSLPGSWATLTPVKGTPDMGDGGVTETMFVSKGPLKLPLALLSSTLTLPPVKLAVSTSLRLSPLTSLALRPAGLPPAAKVTCAANVTFAAGGSPAG